MLVCHCKAVSESVIRDLVAQGARDEFDLADACGAGTDCGGCVPLLAALLDECRACPVRAMATRGAAAER